MKCELKINQELLNRITSIKGGKVRVGWQKDTQYDDGTPVAKVAEINEFGATIRVTDKMRKWFAFQGFPLNKNTTEIHIPPRSFMRSTCDEKKQEWSNVMNSRLKKVFSGELTFEQALEQLGLKIKGDVQEKISQTTTPPNSAMTIAMKGKNTPLRDTGLMLNSISYETEVK